MTPVRGPLAVLDVQTVDGRSLPRAGWTVAQETPVPVQRLRDGMLEVVGRLDLLTVEDGVLWGRGSLTDEVLAARISIGVDVAYEVDRWRVLGVMLHSQQRPDLWPGRPIYLEPVELEHHAPHFDASGRCDCDRPCCMSEDDDRGPVCVCTDGCNTEACGLHGQGGV